jgi:hypothetical protein
MTAPRPGDVAEGLAGAGVIALALVTPFLRSRRTRWGTEIADGSRTYPGDALIDPPAWGWTHAIAIDAGADATWPWVAQVGADRAGFYSYAALENLVGCGVRNADRIHPEWQSREGTSLVLHPRAPAISIVEAQPGSHLLAFAAADPTARAGGGPWTAVTWLLLVEAIDARHCRVISRYRCAHSRDRRTRLSFGPSLLEPIGFAMDRRMLMGIRRRAEATVARGRRAVAA